MSLIHDSLRKLETKQVKNIGSGFGSREASYANHRSFSIKKLWMIILPVAGLALIIYAYSLLSNYQKQNETLLKDIRQMKQDKISARDNKVRMEEQLPKKVIVQPPIVIENSSEQIKAISQNRQNEVIKLNKKLLKANNNTATIKPIVATAKHSNPTELNSIVSKNNTISKPRQKTINSKPRKKNLIARKVKKKKLSVTQTRQLVNNLQMQMELKNKIEVASLLNQLAKSSGKESLVYLRMNAYWSNINNDKDTAVLMYKKILFQKPYDIQAGTNLALIEAKNNNVSQAIKRLELLKNKYPADKNILDYFNKIGAN